MSVELIEKQVRAYVAKDLDLFCSFYSDQIQIVRLPSQEKIINGKDQLRSRYEERFKANYKLEILNRSSFGDFVVDYERIHENAVTKDVILIYEIRDVLIHRAWAVSIEHFIQNIPEKLPEELVEVLAKSGNVRIERIVSKGHTTSEGEWYDQNQNEWVMVVKGSAKLRFEDGTISLHEGDFINIPAHQKHRVEWTDPSTLTVWIAIFY